jgi:hypothetical protein
MSPNDFYVGAIAAFVVILLTKFLAHRERQPEFGSQDKEDRAWWIGHWICVSAAWLGLLLALAALGFPAFEDHDGGARWVTGAAAAIAATILALDVAIPHKLRVSDGQRGRGWSRQPPAGRGERPGQAAMAGPGGDRRDSLETTQRARRPPGGDATRAARRPQAGASRGLAQEDQSAAAGVDPFPSRDR